MHTQLITGEAHDTASNEGVASHAEAWVGYQIYKLNRKRPRTKAWMGPFRQMWSNSDDRLAPYQSPTPIR
jgi:hypothetical protein